MRCWICRERVQFIGKLGSVDKVSVDLGEIHHREIEPRELVERKNPWQVSRLGCPHGLLICWRPCCWRMRLSLDSKQQIRVPARDADAQHTRSETVRANPVAQAPVVLIIELPLGCVAQEGGEQKERPSPEQQLEIPNTLLEHVSRVPANNVRSASLNSALACPSV